MSSQNIQVVDPTLYIAGLCLWRSWWWLRLEGTALEMDGILGGGEGGGERLQALLSQYILFIYERDEVQHTARSRC